MHKILSSGLEISIDNMSTNAVIYRYIDGDFIIIDLNKMAVQTEQISKQEIIGKKLTEVFPNVREFGLFDILLHVHENGGIEYHKRSYYEDERISGWRYNRVSRLPNGDVMALYDDLTKEIDFEEAYNQKQKLLMEAEKIVHLGGWEWDIKTNEIIWSDETYRIFGEVPQSFKPTFEHFISYFLPEYREGMQKSISDALEDKSSYFIDYKIKQKDGEVRYLQSSGHGQYDPKGTCISMMGVVLDITDRKLLEIQNAQSHKKTKIYKDALLKWANVDYQKAEDAIKQATKISAETLDVEYVSIWIYDQERTVLNCISLYSLRRGESIQVVQLDTRRYPNYFKILEAGDSIVIYDSLNDPIASEFLDDYIKPFNIRSTIDTPILHQGKVIGVVSNEQAGTMRDWTSEDIEFTKAIATNVALTLEIEKRRKAEKEARCLTYLIELSDTIVIYWKNEESWPVEYVSKNISLFGYSSEAFISGDIQYKDIIHPEDVERLITAMITYTRDHVDRFTQVYRIFTADGDVRWIEDRTVIQRDDNGDPINYLGTIVDITERRKLENQLQKLATIDSLTGIYNRHKTSEELNIEIDRAKRYGGSLTLIMFDIDHFKEVNDTYGHDIGDYVLKELSNVISEEIRDSDRFGRWGGEEFMLILPESNKNQGMKFAHKLIDRVAMHKFQGYAQITISVGVAIFNETDTNKTLLKRVDNALYLAKTEGRNTVRFQDI